MLITVQEDGSIAIGNGANAFQEQLEDVKRARDRAEIRRHERELELREKALDALRSTQAESGVTRVLRFLAGFLR